MYPPCPVPPAAARSRQAPETPAPCTVCKACNAIKFGLPED